MAKILIFDSKKAFKNNVVIFQKARWGPVCSVVVLYVGLPSMSPGMGYTGMYIG